MKNEAKKLTKEDQLRLKIRKQRRTIKTLRAKNRGEQPNNVERIRPGQKKEPQSVNVQEIVTALQVGRAILRSA